MKIHTIDATRILFLLLVLLFANQDYGQNYGLDSTFNAGVNDGPPQGFVSAIQPDGKILVGGVFRFVNGSARRALVRLNADGTIDSTFTFTGTSLGSVLDIIVLADGKILVAGQFTTDGKSNLVRLNPDGSPDATFNPGGTGVNTSAFRLTSIAVQPDGKIVCAGQGVRSYNGTTNNAIFRVNADGTLDSSFMSGFSVNASIEEVALQTDGKILIALDNPTLYFGVSVRGVMRLNADSTRDTTFNAGGSNANGGVYGLTIQADGRILIGGIFSTYNGTSRIAIARVNSDGTLDMGFTPPVYFELSIVDHIAIQTDGRILASGTLYSTNGLTRSLVRLNTDGTSDGVVAETDDYGYHVGLQPDGKIILTGLFTRLSNGQYHSGILRYNSSGSVDSTFNAALTVYAQAGLLKQQADGKILVVGGSASPGFRTANGSPSYNLARFNLDGTLDSSFAVGLGPLIFYNGSNTDFGIDAIDVQPDGKVLVGGVFGNFNQTTNNFLVRLLPNGAVDPSFELTGTMSTFYPTVEDILVLPDSKILIGSNLLNTVGEIRGLLRLNADGSVDSTFNSGTSADGLVRRILRQPDGKILIAGDFGSYNGASHSGIARVNADGTLDTTFDPGTGASGSVYDMAIQPDGKIIVVGTFVTFNGISMNRIARLNSNGTVDTGFNVGSGANSAVYSVALQSNGRILVGGIFTTIDGTTRVRFARLNSDGSLDTTLLSGFDPADPNTRRVVDTLLVQSDGRIIIGGAFSAYNGIARNNLVRLRTIQTGFDFDGDHKADLSVFRPSVGEWYYQQSSNSVTRGFGFGTSSDRVATADFTGDGKTDIAFWRPSTGDWYVLRSEDSTYFAFPFGAGGDVPAPADYDGDGRADAAVFRPSIATWFILRSSGGVSSVPFGISSDVPVPADYDGDGKADVGIYRPGPGQWWYLRSSNGSVFAATFGSSIDKPVPGDYTGDGKADVAFWRPSNGNWFILRSEDQSFYAFPFGANGDKPAPGDFDGDGKFDAAVFRPSDTNWYILKSTGGLLIQQYGAANDIPLPGAFIP